MKRIALLVCVISLGFAGDFMQAQKNYKNSSITVKGVPAFKTDKGWLAFSVVPIDSSVVKRSDPNLGLYLLKSKQKAPVLKVLNKNPKEVATVTAKNHIKNRVIQEQYGLSDLAQLQRRVPVGNVIMGNCATLRGFSAKDGFVSSRFINDFMYKKDNYTTVGFRLKGSKKGMVVASVNPFFEYNPFEVGDLILYHDAKKESMYALTDSVLRSRRGARHFFLVKRGKSIRHLQVIAKKRFGGGIYADTFLEHLGFNFTKNLDFVFATKNSFAAHLHLKRGDQLIAINNQKVKSDKAIRGILSSIDLGVPLRVLMQRGNFQFFIHIPTTTMITAETK